MATKLISQLADLASPATPQAGDYAVIDRGGTAFRVPPSSLGGSAPVIVSAAGSFTLTQGVVIPTVGQVASWARDGQLVKVRYFMQANGAGTLNATINLAFGFLPAASAGQVAIAVGSCIAFGAGVVAIGTLNPVTVAFIKTQGSNVGNGGAGEQIAVGTQIYGYFEYYAA